MGNKSSSTHRPPPAHEPEPPVCGKESEAPPTSDPSTPSDSSDALINLNLTNLLERLPDIKIDADASLTAPQTGLDVDGVVDVSLGSDGTCEDKSGSIGIDLDAGVGADGTSGEALVSLNSETDALINVPVFGEGGILDGGTAVDVGSLLNAAMLDVGSCGPSSASGGGEAYDGNVPLVSDMGDLGLALGSTLDLLTTTSSLFDVPVLDILGGDGMDS